MRRKFGIFIEANINQTYVRARGGVEEEPRGLGGWDGMGWVGDGNGGALSLSIYLWLCVCRFLSRDDVTWGWVRDPPTNAPIKKQTPKNNKGKKKKGKGKNLVGACALLSQLTCRLWVSHSNLKAIQAVPVPSFTWRGSLTCPSPVLFFFPLSLSLPLCLSFSFETHSCTPWTHLW